MRLCIGIGFQVCWKAVVLIHCSEAPQSIQGGSGPQRCAAVPFIGIFFPFYFCAVGVLFTRIRAGFVLDSFTSFASLKRFD